MDQEIRERLLRNCYSLCSGQTPSGSWNAFKLRPGGSSYWTTAASLAALGSASHTLKASPPWMKRALVRGWEFIEKDRAAKPIGFNELTPCDADSTCWLARAIAYRLAQKTEKLSKKSTESLVYWLEECLNYLANHIDKSGRGLRTYVEEDGILEYVGYNKSVSSWLGAHDCVTANARQLGSEMNRLSTQASERMKATLASLKPGRNAFWWEESIIIDKLLADNTPASSSILWNRETWTLRVPHHADITGRDTIYSKEINIEGGQCSDNGNFDAILTILQASAQREFGRAGVGQW